MLIEQRIEDHALLFLEESWMANLNGHTHCCWPEGEPGFQLFQIGWSKGRRQLQENGSQALTQPAQAFDESQCCTARSLQRERMADITRDLRTETKLRRCLCPPARDGFDRWHRIKCRVAFHAGQFATVEAQEIARRCSLRKERAHPLFVAPDRAADVKHNFPPSG